jgi:NTE family protein
MTWTRRQVLGFLLASAVASSALANVRRPRIGLALGSGGARGLAHLLVFELLDELGLRPHRISGSSIGAVMGSLYAAGISGAEIRELLDRMTVSSDESWLDSLLREDLMRWLSFLQPSLEPGGIVKSEAFSRFLEETAGISRFDELSIPLRVVATDYWEREAVVFESGDLWPAVQASMAMPGLFKPVKHEGRLLVDGGMTNPVPFDLLVDCDLVIAVDVLGVRTPEDSEPDPSSMDNIFNTFQIMQASILREKLKHGEPDFMVAPDIRDVRVMDFYRFEEILRQAEPARDALEAGLRERLDL